MKAKKLQVTIVFEYDGIDNADSVEADGWIEGINEDLMAFGIACGANHVWVDDAKVVEVDRSTTLS